MRRMPWILLATGVAALALILLVLTLETQDSADGPHDDSAERGPSSSSPTDAVLRGRENADASPIPEPPPPGISLRDLPLPAAAKLDVRVVGSGGTEPIEGARVTLDGPGDRRRELLSDANGLAAFDDERTGRARLRVTATGRVPSETMVVLQAGTTAEAVVSLDPGTSTIGRVLSASDGSPIPNASVTCRRGGQLGGMIVFAGDEPVDAVQTDVDGRFSFPGLPDDVICTLRVEAPGFRTREHSLRPGQEGAPELVLRLEVGGTLSGRVYSAEGEAVAEALVFLDCDPQHGVECDEAGRYRLRGLEPDREYRVNASAPGHADSADVDAVLVTSADLDAVLDLTLRRLSGLWIDLVDEQGMPIRSTCEASLGAWPVHGWVATRDEETPGRWRFDEVEPGKQRLQLQVPGFIAIDRYATVAEGETTVLVVKLVRGMAVTGVVVDDLGRPVAGCRMSASLVRTERDVGVRAESDAEGRFKLEGLRDEPHVINASADGHVGPARVTVEDASATVRIELVRRPRVTFRLRAPIGIEPRGGVMVMIASDGGGSGTGHPWNDAEIHSWAEPGPCQLRIEAEGFATWRRNLDLQPGDHQHLGTVLLDRGVDLGVTVHDASGAPVAGATVTLVSDLAMWRLMSRPRTAADGSCVLHHLAPGPHRVEVEADGYASSLADVEVRAAGGDLVVTLDVE